MKQNAQQLLDALLAARRPELPDQWIRVGMDSGGIAAGAVEIFDYLSGEMARRNLDIPVYRTGTLGFSYLDPMIEVKLAGRPPVLYGTVDAALAEKIVEDHLLCGKLVDGIVVGGRSRGTQLEEPISTLLVRDTGLEDGGHTAFLQKSFEDELKERDLEGEVAVIRALDFGLNDQGLTVELYPSGVIYTHVLSKDFGRIVEHSVRSLEVLEDLLYTEPDPQFRIILRNCGIIDPECMDSALERGGYTGLAAALDTSSPEELLDRITESGLRGRGGAGFSTGLKWKLTRKAKGEPKYVICNADEGDPGAFMDRSVLEGDPHAVLEGLLIAGYAMGANHGYFYIRAEYPLAVSRVEKAITEARGAGLLGKNILGSGWDFDAEVRLGAGAFVCGEETALIASVEGRRGSPSPRPPYPSESGLWEHPTCINNVETLAAVPWILTHGAKAFLEIGMGKSRGTKVFAVTGKVRNSQLVEVPMGTPLKTIIYDICGGIQDNLPLKGVQTGGPSGGIIPAAYMDTPVTYENLSELGSIMGSGGMLVLNSSDCMVDVVAFYLKFCVDESCGKCAPCRIGGYQMLQLVEKIAKGRGSEEDIGQIRRICHSMQNASLCGLGQTAVNPVLSSLRYFETEYQDYLEGGPSFARKRKRALAEGKDLSLAS